MKMKKKYLKLKNWINDKTWYNQTFIKVSGDLAIDKGFFTEKTGKSVKNLLEVLVSVKLKC